MVAVLLAKRVGRFQSCERNSRAYCAYVARRVISHPTRRDTPAHPTDLDSWQVKSGLITRNLRGEVPWKPQDPARAPATDPTVRSRTKASSSSTTVGGQAVEQSSVEPVDQDGGRSIAPRSAGGPLNGNSGKRAPSWRTSKTWLRSFVSTWPRLEDLIPTKSERISRRFPWTVEGRLRMQCAGLLALLSSRTQVSGLFGNSEDFTKPLPLSSFTTGRQADFKVNVAL